MLQLLSCLSFPWQLQEWWQPILGLAVVLSR